MTRDPNMPSAFLPGSMEEWFWNYFNERLAELPPSTPEEKAARDALVDKWMQEQRDRDRIEIIMRL